MKRLVLATIIILNIMAWIFYYVNEQNSISSYETNIDMAHKYIDKEIYVDAIKCLENAIDKRPNVVENRLLLAEAYRKIGMDSVFEKYCMQLNKAFPENIDIVIMLGDYYVENGKYQEAINWYYSLPDKVQSDVNVANKIEQLKYTYTIEYGNFDEIYEFWNGYGIYKVGEKYGLIDEYGNNIIDAEYDNIAGVSEINNLLLASVEKNNEYYFIDLNGNRRMIPDYMCEYIGPFSEIGLAVIKVNGKYYYCDSNFTVKSNAFEYATNYVNNRAIVKIDGYWRIVDDNFNFIGDKIENIKVDKYNNAIKNNIIIAIKNDKCFLMNIDGKQIGNNYFDELDFFLNDNIAAYKKSDKWGFVNSIGDIVINEKYQDARSFSCGLAPVKIDDSWGFINVDNKIVIDVKFKCALPFNNAGIAPVMDFKWEILQLNLYLGDT